MFDEATHGERLAWVCLLCHAKSQGRGGKVRLRKNAFQLAYRLSERAVDGMLQRAQKCAAIEVNGDFVILLNWRIYQAKASKAGAGHDAPDLPDSPEIEKKAPTKDTSPSTKDSSLAGKPPKARSKALVERDALWDALCSAYGLKPVSKHECSRIGALVSQLKAYDARPEDIPLRVRQYPKIFPGVVNTENALVKHWPRLAPPRRRDEQQVKQTADYLEQQRRHEAEVLAERQQRKSA